MDHVSRRLILYLLPILVLSCKPQTPAANFAEYAQLFLQLKTDLKTEGGRLWGIELYGPILLVDSDSRQIIANETDDEGLLKPSGQVYSGYLPKEINIANTAIEWHGKRWTMLLLPLPQDQFARRNLLVHELFHRLQPKLNLAVTTNPSNAHLDAKDGRILLRLELAALKAALSDSGNYRHLFNAFTYRNERYKTFPEAREQENQLELNEGLAEYTGLMLSGRNAAQTRRHLAQAIERFEQNPSFVRSFAYVTIPVYGYILAAKNPDWNRQISATTNLTDFFEQAFNYQAGAPATAVEEAVYDRQRIITQEKARAKAKEDRIKQYKKLLVDGPILTLPLVKMQIQFNPTNQQPLGNLGTVYPNLRISDAWGILEADSAALLSSDWSRVTVSAPEDWSKKSASGKGWRLELKSGWKLQRQKTNWTIIKK